MIVVTSGGGFAEQTIDDVIVHCLVSGARILGQLFLYSDAYAIRR
jgi:hypothetical protein